MQYIARLGNAPWVVLGDFNCSLSNVARLPPALSVPLIEGEIVDLDAAMARARGQPEICSFGIRGDTPTRIDGAIADKRVASSLLNVQALQGVEVPGHRPVLFSLALDTYNQKVTKIRKLPALAQVPTDGGWLDERPRTEAETAELVRHF